MILIAGPLFQGRTLFCSSTCLIDQPYEITLFWLHFPSFYVIIMILNGRPVLEPALWGPHPNPNLASATVWEFPDSYISYIILDHKRVAWFPLSSFSPCLCFFFRVLWLGAFAQGGLQFNFRSLGWKRCFSWWAIELGCPANKRGAYNLHSLHAVDSSDPSLFFPSYHDSFTLFPPIFKFDINNNQAHYLPHPLLFINLLVFRKAREGYLS